MHVHEENMKNKYTLPIIMLAIGIALGATVMFIVDLYHIHATKTAANRIITLSTNLVETESQEIGQYKLSYGTYVDCATAGSSCNITATTQTLDKTRQEYERLDKQSQELMMQITPLVKEFETGN